MYINTPFNYTGSKIGLLDQILPLFDYDKRYFVDLFAGGGSVYTNIVDKYDKVLVNDIIKDLIDIHKLLLNNPDDIVEKVKNLVVKKDDQEGYLKLRESYNKEKSPEMLWALMLCCTNNMMRFNMKFEFNQSFGKRTFNSSTQKKIDEFVNHIKNYKEKIFFSSKNFCELKLNAKSMIYCDPPYTNTEAGYNSFWSINLENKLYGYLKNLDKEGHSFALSGVLGEHKNGKRSSIIDNLIKDGFNHKILDHDYEGVARVKNSKNSQEILIYNY
jgi:DNA adenine methylase Dam